MSYSIKDYYKVKKEGEYDWPCKMFPKRKIKIYPDDILTKCELGSFTKHTGLACIGIIINPEDVEHFTDEQQLALL